MIRRDLDLFYDIFSTMNQCYQKQIICLLLNVLSHLNIIVKENEKNI